MCDVPGCGKTYKTHGGLQRHIRAKHVERSEEDEKRREEEKAQKAANRLHPVDLKAYVSKAATKLFEDQCYPEAVRQKFLDFSVSSDEAHEIFNCYKDIILQFKHDPEIFLSEFRKLSKICHNPLKKLDRMSYNLITMEIGVLCLRHLTVKPSTHKKYNESKLSENEYASLQYLAGHVVHKVFLKLRKNKNWSNPEFQIYLQVLKAFKIEPNDHHKLVKAKDRGGLWYICKEAEQIFFRAEMLFRSETKDFIKTLDYSSLVDKLRKEFLVKSKFSQIIENAGITIEPDVEKDILEKLIGLYLRIRCHSYAKDIKEIQKIKEKTSRKKRSLRTELKKLQPDEKN